MRWATGALMHAQMRGRTDAMMHGCIVHAEGPARLAGAPRALARSFRALDPCALPTFTRDRVFVRAAAFARAWARMVLCTVCPAHIHHFVNPSVFALSLFLQT